VKIQSARVHAPILAAPVRDPQQIQRISRRSSNLKENRKKRPVSVAACRVDSSQVLWIANIIGTVRI
jgi:hypothetical protein